MSDKDILSLVEKQLKNVLEAIDTMDDINPDAEFNFAGNDIYSSHVEQSFEEVLKIIKDAKKGKVFYDDKWVDEVIKNEHYQF